MQTLATGATAQLWQELVREAGQRCATTLDETAESYLVFTLVRHSRDAWLTGRTMALELLDSMAHVGGLREERLRDVGDRCLLIAGLFAGQALRRRVGAGYYIDVGRSAYGQLAGDDRNALASLYQTLAGSFQTLVRILRMIRGDTLPPIHPAVTAERRNAWRGKRNE